MFTRNRRELAKISKLLGDLDSPLPKIAKNAAKLLDNAIYPQLKGVFTFEQHDRIWKEHFSRLRGTAVADLLAERFSSGLPNARRYALSALMHMGDDRARPFIFTALKDPEASLRLQATICCTFLRDTSAVPSLIELLSDESVDVVRGAAYSLGYVRALEAIPRLLELATSDNWHYRESAVSALGHIKDQATLPIVRAALKDKHRSVRKAAKFALANFDLERRKDA